MPPTPAPTMDDLNAQPVPDITSAVDNAAPDAGAPAPTPQDAMNLPPAAPPVAAEAGTPTPVTAAPAPPQPGRWHGVVVGMLKGLAMGGIPGAVEGGINPGAANQAYEVARQKNAMQPAKELAGINFQNAYSAKLLADASAQDVTRQQMPAELQLAQEKAGDEYVEKMALLGFYPSAVTAGDSKAAIVAGLHQIKDPVTGQVAPHNYVRTSAGWVSFDLTNPASVQGMLPDVNRLRKLNGQPPLTMEMALNPRMVNPGLRTQWQKQAADVFHPQAMGNAIAVDGQIQREKGYLATAQNLPDNDPDKAGMVSDLQKAVDQLTKTHDAMIQTGTQIAKLREIATQGANVLSPEAIQAAAQQYAETGTMPPGLYRSPGSISAILTRVYDSTNGQNLPKNWKQFAADATSLSKLQGASDAIDAFENTANKNLNMFMQTAKPIVDAKSPWVNKPLRSVDANGLGSQDMAAYTTARTVALTEVARVLSNPGLSGTLTNDQRQEVESLVGSNASLGMIYKAVGVLQADMLNRRTAYHQQIEGIGARMEGRTPMTPAAAPAPAAPAPGRVTAADLLKKYPVGK